MKTLIKTLAVLTTGVGAVAVVKRVSGKSKSTRTIGRGRLHQYKDYPKGFISR